MHSKGINPIVSAVFVLLITIAGIGIVMNIGIPAIEETREKMMFGRAQDNIETLDSEVISVKYGGEGSSVTVPMEVDQGTYTVNSTEDTLGFNYEMDTEFLPPEMCYMDGNTLIRTLGSGRVLDLRLNQEGDTVKDCSSYDNHGKLEEGVWTHGIYGNSVDLTQDGHIKVPNHRSLNPPNGLSVSAWLNTDSTDKASIINKSTDQAGYLLGIDDEKLHWTVRNGEEYTTSTEAVFEDWIFVVGTWNGDEIKIYIDGEEMGYEQAPGIVHTDSPLFIGPGLSGQLERVRIYNRGLGEDEIKTLSRRGGIGVPSRVEIKVWPEDINFISSIGLTRGRHSLLISNRGIKYNKTKIEIESI